MRLATRGDYAHSRAGATALGCILDVAMVGPYHEELCNIVTKAVVDPKGTMAGPARRCGLLGDILREVGLGRAAKFCDLIRTAHYFLRGVDTDNNAVSPRENLAKIKALNAELSAMCSACLQLEQSSRGPVRLKGFISKELFNLLL